jgi:Zn-dependent protease with chaperone function
MYVHVRLRIPVPSLRTVVACTAVLLALTAVLLPQRERAVRPVAARPAPVPPTLSPHELRETTELYLRRIVWTEVWFSYDGRARRELSEPAGERLRAPWRWVLERARKRGFTFRAPELRQTTSEYAFQVGLSDPLRLYGEAFPGANRILINSVTTSMMSEEDLRVLLAHELGHIIDDQTERVGHPVLERFAQLPRQPYADRIAGEIVGYPEALAFHRKYVMSL